MCERTDRTYVEGRGVSALGLRILDMAETCCYYASGDSQLVNSRETYNQHQERMDLQRRRY